MMPDPFRPNWGAIVSIVFATAVALFVVWSLTHQP